MNGSEEQGTGGEGATRVRLSTAAGDILIEVYPQRAPRSAAAFLQFVDAGRATALAFVRAVRPENDKGSPPIAVLQAMPSSGVVTDIAVPHEATAETGLRHGDGALSLGRAAAGTASPAYFFICIGDQPALDHGGGRQADGLGFAVFGRVIAGMDVVRHIHAGRTAAEASDPFLQGQVLADPVAIVAARREATDGPGLLRDLAADYWDFHVREFPSEATAAGDKRFNDRLDGVLIQDHERRSLLAAAMLARAQAIAVSELGDEEALTRDLLIGQLENIRDAWRLGDHLTPKIFPLGFIEIPDYVAAGTTLLSARDFEDFIARLHAIPTYLEASLQTLEAGIAAGFLLPRVLAPRITAAVEAQLSEQGIARTVRAKFAACPPGMEQAVFDALNAAAETALQTAVLPAYRDVRSFFAAHAQEFYRDTISICDQPGGRDYYRFRVRQQTTTDLEPDAIHDIGLQAVAALRQQTAALLSEVGFAGDARAYCDHLAATGFVAPDAKSLLMQARALAKTIDGLLPRLFGRIPPITYGVQSLAVEVSRVKPPAMAQASSADRTTAGIYWLTALPERCPTYHLVPLTLHEAWPGHLMQFAIAHGLAHLPTFRRQMWKDYNAYVEGWGLYCESLGYDLGLYDDPTDRFGQLAFALWRAARLVVDTGIHWKGWSREQAVDCMMDTTLLPRETVETEIDRYIGMPAQALSYRIGEHAIHQFRNEATRRLGAAFSLRDFHDAVLETGAVSLSALERHMQRWLARQCARRDAA